MPDRREPPSAGAPDAVLVTGGNSGIGFECARALARHGWRVVIASRDRAASAAAIRRIAGECGPGAIAELELDLGSLASVRRLAAEIDAMEVPLRALVCNAGFQVSTGPRRSAEGFELTFAVNHLGHFLLANLLLARLVANARARIVVVASGVHDPKLRTGMPRADVGSIETLAASGGSRADRFDGRLAYVNSKLCNLWFAYELARRIAATRLSTAARPLTVNAFDPGLVPGSGLARDYPRVLQLLWDRVLRSSRARSRRSCPPSTRRRRRAAPPRVSCSSPRSRRSRGSTSRRTLAGTRRRRRTPPTTRPAPARSGTRACAWPASRRRNGRWRRVGRPVVPRGRAPLGRRPRSARRGPRHGVSRHDGGRRPTGSSGGRGRPLTGWRT